MKCDGKCRFDFFVARVPAWGSHMPGLNFIIGPKSVWLRSNLKSSTYVCFPSFKWQSNVDIGFIIWEITQTLPSIISHELIYYSRNVKAGTELEFVEDFSRLVPTMIDWNFDSIRISIKISSMPIRMHASKKKIIKINSASLKSRRAFVDLIADDSSRIRRLVTFQIKRKIRTERNHETKYFTFLHTP